MGNIVKLKSKCVEMIKSIISSPKKKRIATIIIASLILLVGVLPIVYYIIGPARGYLTSDTVDSLEWAEAYRKSGQLLSDDYYYAALIPVGGNQIFLPFLAIFGYSMKAQICGMLLFTALLVTSLVYLARGLKLNWFWSMGLTSVTLLLLSSSPKLREIMWEHIFYYNLGILFYCIGFGLAIRLVRDGFLKRQDKKLFIRQLVRLSVFMLFCLVSSMDGIQTVACMSVPLVLALVGTRFLDSETPLLSKKNYWSLFIVAETLIFSLIGIIVYNSLTENIVSEYASDYSTYGDINAFGDNLLRLFVNWMKLFGVDYNYEMPLVSKESIYNMIAIVISIVIFVVPVVLLTQYKKIENEGVRAVLIGHFGVSAFIVFASVFGVLGNAEWRLTPMMFTAIVVTFLAGIEFLKQKKLLARFGALILALLILGSLVSFNTIRKMPRDYGQNNHWHQIAEELEERDLTVGYATFWWTNSVKAISDGGIDIAPVNISYYGLEESHYQASKDSWDDRDTDKYFLMLNEGEKNVMASWLSSQLSKGNIIEDFVIVTEPYSFPRYGTYGDRVYVYVFNTNPMK